MHTDDATSEVRAALQRLQAGYTARDLSRLDEFMELLVASDECELIGIGASVRGGNEWFQGRAQVREIVEADWTYWGDVQIDVQGAKISSRGDAAWLSTSGRLVQTETFSTALEFHLQQMKELLEQEDASADERLLEATHFGMRRLRERLKGKGYAWPFALTAVLVRDEGAWRFHTVHWSMPVD